MYDYENDPACPYRRGAPSTPIYRKLIMAATECVADEVGGVEAFMRDRFRTLDGLSPAEFKEEARAAYANLKALWAEGKGRLKTKPGKKKPQDTDRYPCSLCDRPFGTGRGECLGKGTRGCKIVRGRQQLEAIRGGKAKKAGVAVAVSRRRDGRTVVRAKSLGNTDLRDVFGPPVAAPTVRYGAEPERSAKDVLEAHSTKQAWNVLSERDLLLAFVEEEGLAHELDVFLKIRAHEEDVYNGDA